MAYQINKRNKKGEDRSGSRRKAQGIKPTFYPFPFVRLNAKWPASSC